MSPCTLDPGSSHGGDHFTVISDTPREPYTVPRSLDLKFLFSYKSMWHRPTWTIRTHVENRQSEFASSIMSESGCIDADARVSTFRWASLHRRVRISPSAVLACDFAPPSFSFPRANTCRDPPCVPCACRLWAIVPFLTSISRF